MRLLPYTSNGLWGAVIGHSITNSANAISGSESATPHYHFTQVSFSLNEQFVKLHYLCSLFLFLFIHSSNQIEGTTSSNRIMLTYRGASDINTYLIELLEQLLFLTRLESSLENSVPRRFPSLTFQYSFRYFKLMKLLIRQIWINWAGMGFFIM